MILVILGMNAESYMPVHEHIFIVSRLVEMHSVWLFNYFMSFLNNSLNHVITNFLFPAVRNQILKSALGK